MIYEKNIIQKKLKNIDLRVGLCYPNIYRTAMSSLGYNILYDYLNKNNTIFAERITYPNLRSIETNSSLNEFDIISFSLQYEEDYFNMLKMIHNSNIPINKDERTNNHPLIIAGGPTTANPAPLSKFIDLFIIGEAEGILDKVTSKYLKYGKNLKEYLDISGVYIPKFKNKTKIRVTRNMNDAHHIKCPIVSKSSDLEYQSIFKDSIFLNVSRGCSRGCRFCMSSYLYRPMRETNLNLLIDTALSLRKNTGLNKVTLIGAAVSDYRKLTELIDELKNNNFEISTPSMRLESITKEQLKTLKETNLKTITLAPESIDRLRKSINKEISDEKIFDVVKNAFDLGFNIKLYFIIGLPGETMDDIVELVDFMKKLASFRNGNSIKFSLNPMIPKPHTPMQWVKYNMNDVKKKMRFIKKEMKNYKIKMESPKKGMVQYILSCGDEGVCEVIEKTLTQKITNKEWKEYLPNYSIDDSLPWDNINVGVKKEFLKKEYEKMKTLEQTPWCVVEKCYKCGACIK